MAFSGKMFCITTSRKPSQKTRSFCKILSLVFNKPYIQRGKRSLIDLREISKKEGCIYFLIIKEYKGNPGKIEIIDIRELKTLHVLKFKSLYMERYKIVKELKRQYKEEFQNLIEILIHPRWKKIFPLYTENIKTNSKTLLKIKIKGKKIIEIKA